MSKLNKVFLAIVIALLITAVAETLFIFVYKPPQTVPVPQTAVSNATPISSPATEPAFNRQFLDSLKTQEKIPNQKLELNMTTTGTIDKIDEFGISVNISDNPKTRVMISFTYNSDKSARLKMFQLNPITGVQAPITVNDLRVGDKAMYTITSDVSQPPEMAVTNAALYKLK